MSQPRATAHREAEKWLREGGDIATARQHILANGDTEAQANEFFKSFNRKQQAKKAPKSERKPKSKDTSPAKTPKEKAPRLKYLALTAGLLVVAAIAFNLSYTHTGVSTDLPSSPPTKPPREEYCITWKSGTLRQGITASTGLDPTSVNLIYKDLEKTTNLKLVTAGKNTLARSPDDNLFHIKPGCDKDLNPF